MDNKKVKKVSKQISIFKQLINPIRNNLGHKKFSPLISVINRVLKRLPIASTKRNEFVESKAWLISIQKLASIRAD